MGVKDLWTILSPICERKSLYELHGKAIAIDLSCWVVEDQTIAVYSTQPRMYLRNLFFRTSCLLMLGARPVFVLEGEAPALKLNTMAKRNEVQFKSQRKNSQATQSSETSAQSSQNGEKRGKRTRLKSLLKQCEDMLTMMGVSCVQSSGEAEALCAQLNCAGLVDGCITQDGDCFLYGADTVYRNFTISAQGGSSSSGYSVDVYTMTDIAEKLRLDRDKLVALAVLCGCDYGGGVAGVGRQMAMAFLDALTDEPALERMKRWRTDSHFERLERERVVLTTSNICDNCCHAGKLEKHKTAGCRECGCARGCSDNIATRVITQMTDSERKTVYSELNLRKKALVDAEFPSSELISEFLHNEQNVGTLDLDWSEPNLDKFIRFAVRLLSWTEQYAVEKLLPLVTRWQLTHLHANKENPRRNAEFCLTPTAIVKQRVQKGIPSYELRWRDNLGLVETLELDDGATPEQLLLSVEPQSLVDEVYPSLVEVFREEKEAKKKGKKKAAPKKPRKQPVIANDRKQTKINAFLLPSQPSQEPNEMAENIADMSLDDISPIKPPTKARIKPIKKPVVTISSLLKAVNRVNSKSQGNCVKENKTTAKVKLQSKKRLASPCLKVGLKLSKMSTPQKRTTPLFELERSFKNISLLEDYEDDDGDFSDLSGIINDIVNFNDSLDLKNCFEIKSRRFRSKEVTDMSETLPIDYSELAPFGIAESGCVVDRSHNFGLDNKEDAGEKLTADSSESDDEFDMCKRKFVPLLERAMARCRSPDIGCVSEKPSAASDSVRDSNDGDLEKLHAATTDSSDDEFDMCKRKFVPLYERAMAQLSKN